MTKEEVLAKIEAEEAGAFGEDIRLIVEVWIKHDDAAASMVEKILEAEKESSLKRCLDFMKGKAKTKAVKGCYHPEDAEAAGWILEFYGEQSPQKKLEEGLMYAIFMEKTERFKPYGVQRQEAIKMEAEKKEDLLGVSMDDLF